MIPGRYAALLVHRRGRVRPKHAHQEVVSAIMAQQEGESCRDVITWLRATCTARGDGGAQTAVHSVHHAFAAVHLPPEAYYDRYETMKVHADLPSLREQEQGGRGLAMANALHMLLGVTTATGGGDGEGGGRAKQPRTIADTYTTLL